MASKKTLIHANLKALGADRLAELLLEITAGDANAKRRLRLELAGRDSADAVAAEVRKRLASLSKATSFVSYQKCKELAADLDTQRRAIVEQLAPRRPAEALELAWRLFEVVPVAARRCEDGGERVGAVSATLRGDVGPIAEAAQLDPATLADRAAPVLAGDSMRRPAELVLALAPALGRDGLARLRRQLEASAPARPDTPSPAFAWADPEASNRFYAVKSSLAAIADVEGNPDAYAALYDGDARKLPHIAVEIADRLHRAGRHQEALAYLEACDDRTTTEPSTDWALLYTDLLQPLGCGEQAQSRRWHGFERKLDPDCCAPT